MTIDELKEYIEANGCPVKIKNKYNPHYIGLFYNIPVKIEIYSKGHSKHEIIKALAHEYCHYLQYQDGFYNTVNYSLGGFYELEKWRCHKKISKKKAKCAMAGSMILEHDCEKRTIELIKELNLPINVDKYARQANAYIASIKNDFKIKGHTIIPLPFYRKGKGLITESELVSLIFS